MGNNKSTNQSEPYWLVYIALVLAGIMLLADAYYIAQLSKWTARIGIALIYSAIAMFVGNGRWPGHLAVVIVWLAVILTYIF
jgi:TctA family transporter